MADINLLQGSEVFEAEKKSNLRFFKWLGFFLFGLAILAYVALFVMNKSLEKRVVAATQRQVGVEQEIIGEQGYDQLLSSQSKIKNIKLLLDQHLIWSDMIQKFSAATLNTATYSKFTATSDGSLIITGLVPDFQNLDKLYKAYLLSNFSDYIKEVKLTSVSLGGSDQQNQSGVNFTIKVTFNKQILLPPSAGSNLSISGDSQ